jgi:HlyD family secretion protein
MKSKGTKIIVFSLAILVAIGLGYYFISKKKASKIKIDTAVVLRGDISNAVTATGTIKPVTQIDIGTQVSGVVRKIYVDFNSKVKAGQLIAELDKVNLKASVEEARANLNTAINDKEYLQRQFERQEGLYKNKNISQLDYEDAQYKLANAKNAVLQRETDLSRALTNLSFANIYSPIEGVVLSRGVNVGQTVAASFSTPTLFTIAQDLRKMQVEANVDEADIGSVKEGQRVTFTVDAYPNDDFEGKVTQVRLNATTTSNVVTYTVVVKADNPDEKLLPGLTATISIYTFEIKDVLMASSSAINFKPDKEVLAKYFAEKGMERHKPEGKEGEKKDWKGKNKDRKPNRGENDSFRRVWVKRGDSLRPVPVTIGSTDGINTEILKGLQEGDTLVSNLREEVELPKTKTGGQGNSGSPFMPTPPRQRRR